MAKPFPALIKIISKADNKTEGPAILVVPVSLHVLEVFRTNFQWCCKRCRRY